MRGERAQGAQDEQGEHDGVVVVTGGSRGIGRAIVESLLERQQTVVFTFRSAAAAAEELVAANQERAYAYQLDLADRAGSKEFVRRVEGEVGPIVGLVNNAGQAHSGLLAMTSDEQWDQVIDVNLGGTFRLMRAVVPQMVRRRQGAIVNVASLAALRGVGGQAAYAASKAGVLALTRTLAREVAGRGIRVNAVVPGFVATEMTEDLPQRAVERLRAPEALSRGVKAEDVASAVCFLLSSEAASITGQSLPIDAGASV